MNRVTMPDAAPQLLIVAESLLSRVGLSALLEERGCFVIGGVDGANLAREIDRLTPDILVVDFGWAGEALRDRLAPIDKDLPILALVAEDAEPAPALALLLRAFSRFALLPRDIDPDAIVAAVNALEDGLIALDPRLTPWLEPPPQEAERPPSPLTARENEVLQLLARGLTNRAIAHELGITQHTVKFHVNAIMSKLDAQSRTEAVVRASQSGLIIL